MACRKQYGDSALQCSFVLFLESFRCDVVGKLVMHDDLILEFARSQFDVCGHNPDQYESARSKIREMARLLIDLRETGGSRNGSAQLKDFISPEKVDSVIASTRRVSGFDEYTQEFTYMNIQ